MTAAPGKSLPHETAVRKDPAVHVSLSSDSVFKQPERPGRGRSNSHPPANRRAVEARASENCRIPFHCSSEELQQRASAPGGGRRAEERYIGQPPFWCQHLSAVRGKKIASRSRPGTGPLSLVKITARAAPERLLRRTEAIFLRRGEPAKKHPDRREGNAKPFEALENSRRPATLTLADTGGILPRDSSGCAGPGAASSVFPSTVADVGDGRLGPVQVTRA